MTCGESARGYFVAVLGAVLVAATWGCGGGGTGGGVDVAADSPAARTTTETVPVNDYGDTMPHPTVTLSTSLGDIRLELFPEDAPVTVPNFVGYVEEGFYDGLIFHRVISGFMIQAGGHGPDMAQKEASGEAIANESRNGLRNLRGTVAMARTGDPHSARAQFFINLVDNANLDHGPVDDAWGYAVFGRVIGGMEVVDAIAGRPTGIAGPYRDVPVEPVFIVSATRGEDIQPGG